MQALHIALKEKIDSCVAIGDRSKLERIEVYLAVPVVVIAHEAGE